MTRNGTLDGLKDEHRDAIIRVLAAHPRIERAVLFGSRAMGTFSPAADVDIALVGDSLDPTDLARLSRQMDELTVPQKVDLLLHRSIRSPELLEHIRRHGVEWYRRSGRPNVGHSEAHGSLQTFLASDLIDRGLLEIGEGYRAKNSEMSSSGLPFVRVANVKDGIETQGVDILGWPSVKKAGSKVSRPGDVVFTAKGTVGRQAFVSARTPKFVYSPQIRYWRSLDPDVLDPRFLFYWFQGPEFSTPSSAVKGQTDMADYVSLTDMRRVTISIPPLPNQRRIAHILGTLDDKIELNRRTNETLEAMARALFKSWFVDFDPVRAKAAGHQPEGMDADTAALFPDSFEESELGEIPNGWRAARLGEVLELKRGYDLPAGARRPGLVPIVSSSGPSGWHDEARAKAPGVVTGRYGTIGQVFLVLEDFWPLNTTLYLHDCKGNSLLYCYYLLSQLDFGKFSDKAAVPGVNRNHVHEEFVLHPPASTQERFGAVAGVWLNAVALLNAQAQALSDVRDALLPRLLSGELASARVESVTEATE